MKQTTPNVGNILILIMTCLFLSGCSDSGTKKMDKYTAEAMAKYLLEPKLKDAESAIFSSITYKDETADRPVIICGLVNSKNSFGGMTGNQRFILGGAIMIEEEFTTEQMNTAWQTFCL